MRTSVKLISSITLCMSVIGGSQVVKAFQGDKRAEDQIRKALADWVAATNRRDEAAADTIWGPNVVGWFPAAPEFSRSAAFAAARLPEKKDGSYSTFELKIDEVAVSGSIAAVYDIWTETKHFNGSSVKVKRLIRGNEFMARATGWQMENCSLGERS